MWTAQCLFAKPLLDGHALHLGNSEGKVQCSLAWAPCRHQKWTLGRALGTGVVHSNTRAVSCSKEEARNFTDGCGYPQSSRRAIFSSAQDGMLRGNAAYCQPRFCSVCSFMDHCLWEEGGKAFLVSFTSLIFLMNNISLALFGGFGTLPVASLDQRIDATFPRALDWPLLTFHSSRQLYLFLHLFPRLITASQERMGLVFFVPALLICAPALLLNCLFQGDLGCQQLTSSIERFLWILDKLSFPILFPFSACYQHFHHLVTVLKLLVTVQP